MSRIDFEELQWTSRRNGNPKVDVTVIHSSGDLHDLDEWVFRFHEVDDELRLSEVRFENGEVGYVHLGDGSFVLSAFSIALPTVRDEYPDLDVVHPFDEEMVEELSTEKIEE